MLPKEFTKALCNRSVFTESLFKRPESLGALLPYDEYLEQDRIFLMKDGSLGAVFKVSLLEHEPMTGEQIVSQIEKLKTWFSLPENCVLQILFDQSSISYHDPLWKTLLQKYENPHPVAEALQKERVRMFQSACGTENTVCPLSRNTYLAIRFFPECLEKKKIQTILENGEMQLLTSASEYLRELKEFKNIVDGFEQDSKIPLHRLGAKELIDFLRRFFNPKEYYKRSFAEYNAKIPVSDQVIFNSPTLDFEGIEREGIRTRVISLKTSPLIAYPGGMANFTKVTFPFKIALSFSFPGKAKVKRFFDMKDFFLDRSPSAKAQRQKEEVLMVQKRLAFGDRVLHMTFNVIVEGNTNDELDKRTREIVNIFHNDLEAEVIRESDIGLGLCLNSLPLNYSPDVDYSTQRAIRILQSDVLNFLPVFDSFRGLKEPLQLYLSRENNLVPFSLFENETSNHTVVLADSGSGKSAFIIDCIQAVKKKKEDPLVFIIDKKSSYKMIARLFDGDLTIFDPNNDMPFSPFRGNYDEAKVNFLTQLLLTAVSLVSPNFQVESEHLSALSKAIKLAYKTSVDQRGLSYRDSRFVVEKLCYGTEISIDDIVREIGTLKSFREFETSAHVLNDLIVKLKPFYGDGPYAKYFGSTSQSERKSTSFYAYDLDALDSDPTLQTLMTMSVFEEIRQIIAQPENRSRGGIVICEELGRIGGDNPVANRYIVDFAETLRKLGFWLIALAPRPQNYFDSEAGRAMWGVADNFLFLKMSADNVRYLREKSALFDEANSEIIASLQTRKGQYTELFYMNKNKSRQGAFRYHQTTLDRWLAPTNHTEWALAEEALNRFSEQPWQALVYLANTYPNGA